jgi:hypothetical protein
MTVRRNLVQHTHTHRHACISDIGIHCNLIRRMIGISFVIRCTMLYPTSGAVWIFSLQWLLVSTWLVQVVPLRYYFLGPREIKQFIRLYLDLSTVGGELELAHEVWIQVESGYCVKKMFSNRWDRLDQTNLRDANYCQCKDSEGLPNSDLEMPGGDVHPTPSIERKDLRPWPGASPRK